MWASYFIIFVCIILIVSMLSTVISRLGTQIGACHYGELVQVDQVPMTLHTVHTYVCTYSPTCTCYLHVRINTYACIRSVSMCTYAYTIICTYVSRSKKRTSLVAFVSPNMGQNILV